MMRLVAIALASIAGAAPAPSLGAAPLEFATLPTTPALEDDAAALAEAWRDALELDRPADVVRAARTRLTIGAPASRDGRLLALYARALSATGGAEEATSFLRTAQPSATTRGEVEVALARLDLEADRLDAVVARLASKQAGQPVQHAEVQDAWIVLAKAYQRKGDVASAVPLLQEFVKRARLSPEAPSAWHLLAQAALAARDLDNARRFREQSQSWAAWQAFYKTRRIQVLEAPDDPLPRFGLAQLWASVDELERARVSVGEALERDPEFARAWALAGELERKTGNTAAAITAYGKALGIDPTLTDARFNRALLALAAEDAATARGDLEHIVDGQQSTAERYLGAHLLLARLLRDAGESEAADKRFARYQRLGGTETL